MRISKQQFGPSVFKKAEKLSRTSVSFDALYFFSNFQNESQEEEQELSEVFMKTLNYTQRFAKFKNMENIAAVRSLVHFSVLCL